MVCILSAEKLNCLEYKLNVTLKTIYDDSVYTCSFEHAFHNACKCILQIPGFVIGETFQASLLRADEKLMSKAINTEKNIKPKRPTILSVNLTKNGNFLITWDTNYTSPLQKAFSESLSIQLTYSINGSKDNSSTQVIPLEKGRTNYEIVGRSLQSNSVYVVMARVTTEYNNNSRFSDYSQPYKFITPTSVEDILKIIIPILCVILIIFISILFYCYIKTKKQWWDKIPTPKIVSNFEKTIPFLPSTGNNFSPVYLDASKLNSTKDKTCALKAYSSLNRTSTTQVGVSCEDSLQSLGKSGDSSQVIYAQTVSGDVEENVTGNKAPCELLEEYKSPDRVQSNRSSRDTQRECENSSCSSFSNRCYLGSDSSGSSFLYKSITHTAYPSNENENSFSALPNLDPVIPTDFEYGPCNGCSVSGDSTQLTPFSPETVVVPGYQSVKEILDHGQTRPNNQVFISYHNDINLIMAKNPQSLPLPACDNIIIPVDDGYQSFPSLDQNPWSSDHSTEEEQNSSKTLAQTAHHNMSCISQQVHAPSCGPVLNISPGIQIDCAYQKV
ncbi:hypothetical protein NFI96_024092 [Prochilodus magdalenae]|nr:hypothetical protein NFI96_024092 [Prochilodus magdalenae]